MAGNETISSTERLLEVIRGKTDTMPPPPDSEPVERRSTPAPPLKTRIYPFRNQATVGVSIGYNDIKFAEIIRSSDKNLELRHVAQVPFESGMSPDSPQFSQFLKAALTRFCGSSKHVDVWSAISSAKVEVRYLRIPKVPKKQVANAVFWSFRKEVSFNETEDIFDFEVLGEINDDGVRKMEVLAYSAPGEEIRRIESLFSKSGYPLKGVTIIPFVIQNLFRTGWIESAGKTLCTLYIGRSWSRIDIFWNGNLVLSRGIKAGIGSMVEAIRQEVFTSPIKYTIEIGGPDDTEAFETIEDIAPQGYEESQKIFWNFIGKRPSWREIDGSTLDDEEILKMILPALDRLVRQVERTLDHFSFHFGSESVSKIYISGPVGQHQLLVHHITEQLGFPIDVLDPFYPASSVVSGAFVPEKLSERESFVPAVGMALSHASITPNFIFTYRDKATDQKHLRTNYAAFSILILIMCMGMGIFFWQNSRIAQKEIQTAQLKRQVENLTPHLDQKLIEDLVDQTLHNRLMVHKLGKRYIGLSAISELSSLTPPNIRLSSIIAEMGEHSENSPKSQKKLFLIDGIISGDRLTFESSLADYLITLKTSPLFDKPNIKKKSFEIHNNKETMRFTAELELVSG